jgi:hypothetical protein
MTTEVKSEGQKLDQEAPRLELVDIRSGYVETHHVDGHEQRVHWVVKNTVSFLFCAFPLAILCFLVGGGFVLVAKIPGLWLGRLLCLCARPVSPASVLVPASIQKRSRLVSGVCFGMSGNSGREQRASLRNAARAVPLRVFCMRRRCRVTSATDSRCIGSLLCGEPTS